MEPESWTTGMGLEVTAPRVHLPSVEQPEPALGLSGSEWAMLARGGQVLCLAVLIALALIILGCDEESIPEVHGTITVSPSPGGPVPPFEVQFRDEPSPTPVDF